MRSAYVLWRLRATARECIAGNKLPEFPKSACTPAREERRGDHLLPPPLQAKASCLKQSLTERLPADGQSEGPSAMEHYLLLEAFKKGQLPHLGLDSWGGTTGAHQKL